MLKSGAAQADLSTIEYPMEHKFPSLFKNYRTEKVQTPIEDSSTLNMNLSSHYSHLQNEVNRVSSFARIAFDDLDPVKLNAAVYEANQLVACGLFEAEIVPDVSIDRYGEITFSHKSSAGYIDIGVRGVGELSYNVRNDIEPQASRYDDHDWHMNNQIVPVELYNAIVHLRNCL